MLRFMIEAVEGGKEIYGGGREVHYEVRDGVGNGENFGRWRWLT